MTLQLLTQPNACCAGVGGDKDVEEMPEMEALAVSILTSMPEAEKHPFQGFPKHKHSLKFAL